MADAQNRGKETDRQRAGPDTKLKVIERRRSIVAETEAHQQQEPDAESTSPSLLDRWFKLSERDTNLRTELAAGLTTFMTISS